MGKLRSFKSMTSVSTLKIFKKEIKSKKKKKAKQKKKGNYKDELKAMVENRKIIGKNQWKQKLALWEDQYIYTCETD